MIIWSFSICWTLFFYKEINSGDKRNVHFKMMNQDHGRQFKTRFGRFYNFNLKVNLTISIQISIRFLNLTVSVKMFYDLIVFVLYSLACHSEKLCALGLLLIFSHYFKFNQILMQKKCVKLIIHVNKLKCKYFCLIEQSIFLFLFFSASFDMSFHNGIIWFLDKAQFIQFFFLLHRSSCRKISRSDLYRLSSTHQFNVIF